VSDITTKIMAKDGQVCVYREQDVESVLKANQVAMNEAPTWRPYASGRKDVALRHVAEIPAILAEQWFAEGINIFSADPDMQKKFRKKLNDWNYRKLRTYPGRLRETGK
jgi:hypothetical protein